MAFDFAASVTKSFSAGQAPTGGDKSPAPSFDYSAQVSKNFAPSSGQPTSSGFNIPAGTPLNAPGGQINLQQPQLDASQLNNTPPQNSNFSRVFAPAPLTKPGTEPLPVNIQEPSNLVIDIFKSLIDTSRTVLGGFAPATEGAINQIFGTKSTYFRDSPNLFLKPEETKHLSQNPLEFYGTAVATGLSLSPIGLLKTVNIFSKASLAAKLSSIGQSVASNAAIGALFGASAPAENNDERAKNALMGGLLGGGAGVVFPIAGNLLGSARKAFVIAVEDVSRVANTAKTVAEFDLGLKTTSPTTQKLIQHAINTPENPINSTKDLFKVAKTDPTSINTGIPSLDKSRAGSISRTDLLREETLAGKREDLRLDTPQKIKSLNVDIPTTATPETKVTVFRAGTGNISPGDQVTTIKENATRYVGLRPGTKVWSDEVTVNTLVKNQGLRNEFIYAPKELRPLTSGTTAIGEVKISKVASSIEANAIEKNLTTKFKDLAGYGTITVKDQARRVADLLSNDFARAVRIISGQEELPSGMRAGMLIDGMEQLAKKRRDLALMSRLASSPLVSETSIHAQELRLLRERNPNSVLTKVAEVLQAKKMVLEKKYGKPIEQVIKDEAKNITFTAPSKVKVAEFIRALEC